MRTWERTLELLLRLLIAVQSPNSIFIIGLYPMVKIKYHHCRWYFVTPCKQMKREGSTRGVNLEHRKAFPHWIFFSGNFWIYQVIEFLYEGNWKSNFRFCFCITGHRFRQLLLWASTRLHLHPVSFLSCPRSHSWRSLWHAHWYVEFGLHLGRIINRLSPASWRRRGRPIVMYHRASGHAPSETPWPKQTGKELYQLKR